MLCPAGTRAVDAALLLAEMVEGPAASVTGYGLHDAEEEALKW
ncbi:hypothetical protein ACIGW0_23315 [Streptomyces bikiniensis]|uniref:Uncharacterized protein n=1 Tax=Streptomyces bikiniensis TaxID=1896 RepID=A0ABW8CXS7_STRBI